MGAHAAHGYELAGGAGRPAILPLRAVDVVTIGTRANATAEGAMEGLRACGLGLGGAYKQKRRHLSTTRRDAGPSAHGRGWL